MRTPVPHRSPPARIFAEQKCLAADKCLQICCSAERSLDILQTSKALHTRKRVLPKYVEDCPIGKAMQIRNSRDLKRAAALLFPKESRENPFEGFSLGNFFLTADAVLLCAAKKNSDSRWRLCRLTDMGCRAGVGKWTSWQVSASLNWRLRHCKKKQISY